MTSGIDRDLPYVFDATSEFAIDLFADWCRYKNATWCPNPGVGVLTQGPSAWGYLEDFVQATLGGQYSLAID